MTDWGPIGGDPAPGHVAAIRDSSSKLRTSAKDAILLKGALERIQRNSQELRWHGEGGDAFRGRLRDLPAFLGLLTDSHEALSTALTQYAATLDGLQVWAAQILQMAVKAQADAANARHRHDSAAGGVRDASARRDAAHRASAAARSLWNTAVHSPTPDPTQTALLHQKWVAAQSVATRADAALSNARADLEHCARDVANADERLRIARGEADKIRGQAADARRHTARLVNDASHIHIPDDPLYSTIWHATVEVLRPNSATETYLRFLGGLSQALQWIGMIPIPGLSVVTGTIATGLAITILFGRVLQALYGQRPWGSIAGETLKVLLTATSMIPMGKALGSSSLMGQAKRVIWYNDARHAVGGWRQVAVAPKLTSELLKQFPGIAPSTVYRVGTVLHWTAEAKGTADKVAQVADFGFGVYYDLKGQSWSSLPAVVGTHGVDAVYGDGTSDHIKAAVHDLGRGDVQGAAGEATDIIYGDGTAGHIQAGMEAASSGNAPDAIDEGARAILGDDTMDKVTTAGDDIRSGDIIKGIGDLGE